MKRRTALTIARQGLAIPILCLLAGCTSSLPPWFPKHVPASAETDPIASKGDRADDPALWIHPADPALSIILATNKESGLHVYDLAGREQAVLQVGRVNNVDVRGDLAVATNEEVNGLSWFRIDAGDATVTVRHLGDTKLARAQPYGTCLGRVGDDLVVNVTYPNGTLELWRAEDRDDHVAITLTRTAALASQTEGCVIDDAEKRLFVGEEDHGIWALDLDDPESAFHEVDTIAAHNGLAEDVEGLTLYLGADGTGYLIASAQSEDRFVFYDRLPPYRLVGAIRVVQSSDGTVDAVTHTDGIDATSVPLPQYPRGLLVVQDDANPRMETNQNFKLIDWRNIEHSLALPTR